MDPELQRADVCALVSGGVDSAVLVACLLRDGSSVQPVYVEAGMAWETVERAWLERYLAAIPSPSLLTLRALALPVADAYGSHWSVDGIGPPGYEAPDEEMYLPGRNLLLIAKAAVYCVRNGIDRIAVGLLAGNPFPDATDTFFDALSRSLSLGLATPIQIERPFAGFHKEQVLALGRDLPLELTFSCVSPVGELHCGDCNKCAERQRGFRNAGMADPTRYVAPPPL
jgi:7-cyano-7-deazaguanine synthase